MRGSASIKKIMGAVAALALLITGWMATPASAVQTPQPKLVSDNPANWTPNVLDGQVESIVQVGNRIVVGGTFTQVQEAGSGKPVLNRSGVFSFNATTGVIDAGFAPSFDAAIKVVVPAGDGTSVFVGGNFSTVNGTTSRRVTRVNLSNGAITSGFRPASFDGAISDLRLVGSNLVVAGRFLNVGGQPRTGLASLNPATGAVTGFVNFSVTDPRAGTMNVQKIDVTPDGSRLVAIGNFSKIDGADRPQLAMFDTAGPTATLADWRTPFYALDKCSSAFWSYMRDLDIDPTGTYMVVTTTGAYGGPDSPCDVEARFEINQTGSDIAPTWRSYTGGDTTYAVAITGTVVYVGGHMRWMNNPFAGDAKGPGAVDRPGIAAIDPRNGIPFSWNPGRDRGVGVFDMLATSDGLWIGSDTDRVAGEVHKKLAFFPLAGGKELPDEKLGTVPNDTYLLGKLAGASDPSVLYRVNAGGPELSSVDDGPDWSAGDNTPYVNTGNNAGYNPVPNVDASVPAAQDDRAPRALFDSERWDSGGAPEMTWSFPVPAGKNLQVRLFLANRYTGTSGVGQRVFDVSLDGTVVLDDLDMVARYGDQTGHVESFNITSDGSVDISFGHVVENPLVNGIEIIDRDAVGTGSSTAGDVVRRQYFNGTSAPSNPALFEGTQAWGFSRGAMLIDDTVYAGWADGTFTKRAFDGETFGNVGTVDLSGGSFGSDVTSVTGMFYDKADARMYYTLTGSDQLFWRGFLPESDVVGAARFTAGGDVGALNPRRVRGMFVSGDTLYFADRDSGSLYSVGFSNGTVTGPATEVDASIDWRTRGAFVWNGTPAPAVNVPPTAAAVADCTGLVCAFDASASSDSDGIITDYAWDFGDGETASGKNATHTYAVDGTYTVRLTVTDDRGGNAIATESVTVARPPNVAPTAKASAECTGLVCAFDASASSDSDGTIDSYAWDFGDGTTGTGKKPDHTYAVDGTYTATLTVTDDRGGQATDTVSVTVTRPANVDPTAKAAVNCTDLTCAFDGSASTDSDGTITGYAWDFGDGAAGTGAKPSHTYATPGTYQVTLTVTDDRGAQATDTVSATATEPPVVNVGFRDSATSMGNVTTARVDIPSSVKAGDLLLLFASTNTGVAPTSAPAGWQQVDNRPDGSDLRTVLYKQTATASSAGNTVTVTLPTQSKTDLTLLAYSGVDASDPIVAVSSVGESASTAGHLAPALTGVATSNWVVTYWVDKSSSTTAWTVPNGQTKRAQNLGAGGGRLTSVAADAGPIGVTTWPGVTATADNDSGKATMWSIALK